MSKERHRAIHAAMRKLAGIRMRDPVNALLTKSLLTAICCTCLVSMNGLAVAGEPHGAHQHGVANLTLASENGTLEVQFESPAMSLLGFEHQPKTKQQMETIEKTKELLSSLAKILSIEGANCSANTVNVEIHGPAGQTLQGFEKHERHESEEKHDGHDASHSEFFATYRFACIEGEKIRSVSVALFDTFPKLESITANWVTESQQGQITLRPTAATIEFK